MISVPQKSQDAMKQFMKSVLLYALSLSLVGGLLTRPVAADSRVMGLSRNTSNELCRLAQMRWNSGDIRHAERLLRDAWTVDCQSDEESKPEHSESTKHESANDNSAHPSGAAFNEDRSSSKQSIANKAKHLSLLIDILLQQDKEADLSDLFAQREVTRLIDMASSKVKLAWAELMTREAEYDCRLGKESRCKETIDQVLDVLSKDKNASTEDCAAAEYVCALNETINNPKDYSDAEQRLKRVLFSLHGTRSKAGLVNDLRCKRGLACILDRQGKFAESEQLSSQTVSKIVPGDYTDMDLARLFLVLGRAQYHEKKYREAIASLETAHQHAVRLGSPYRLDHGIHQLLGLSWYAVGDHQQAARHLQPLSQIWSNKIGSMDEAAASYISAELALPIGALDADIPDSIFYLPELKNDHSYISPPPVLVGYSGGEFDPVKFDSYSCGQPDVHLDRSPIVHAVPTWNGTCYAEFGSDQVIAHLSSAVSAVSHLLPDSEELLKYEYALEHACARMRRFEHGKKASADAIALAQKLHRGDGEDYWRATADHAWCAVLSGDAAKSTEFKQSLKDMEDAENGLSRCPSAEDRLEHVHCLERLSQLYYLDGQCDKALRCMARALDAGRAHWTKRHMAFALNYLAALAKGAQDWSSASRYGEELLSVTQDATTRLRIVMWLQSGALIAGKPVDSLAFGSKAIELATHSNYQRRYSYLRDIHLCEGTAANLLGRRADALNELQKASDNAWSAYRSNQGSSSTAYKIGWALAQLKEYKAIQPYNDGVWHWPTKDFPLSVHMQPPDGELCQSTYSDALSTSLKQWTTASHGAVSFKTISKATANIEVRIVPNTIDQELDGECNSIDYRLDKKNQWVFKNTDVAVSDPRRSCLLPLPLELLYGLKLKNGLQRINPCAFDASEFHGTLLHELGHAIGLNHSPFPEDIMFFSSLGSKLSQNDVASLQSYLSKTGMLKEQVSVVHARDGRANSKESIH